MREGTLSTSLTQWLRTAMRVFVCLIPAIGIPKLPLGAILTVILFSCLTIKTLQVHLLKKDKGKNPINRRKSPWIFRVWSLALFIFTVFALKQIDVFWADFDRSGPIMAFYSVFRLILFFYLILICQSVGAVILRVLPWKKDTDSIEDVPYLILSFFLGAFSYSIILKMAGFLGFLNLPVALMCTIPALLFFPTKLMMRYRSLSNQIYNWFLGQNGSALMLNTVLVGCMTALSIILTISKVLFPESKDPDIWVHYIPYFKQVLKTGSIGPNAVWYHFYISQGETLAFLAGLLSDALATNLCAACSVVMMALMLFHILNKNLRNTSWSLFGVIIMLSALCFDFSAGAFTKGHLLAASFMSALLWFAIQLETKAKGTEIYIFAMIYAAFFVGTYQPIVIPLILPFFLLLSFLSFLSKERWRRAYFYLGAAAATVLGSIMTFAINYSITGLAYLMPIQIFRRFANISKISEVFGTAGITYFYAIADVEDSIVSGWGNHLDWIRYLLRYDFFNTLFPFVYIAPLAIGMLFLYFLNGRFRRVPTLEVVFVFLSSVLGFTLFAKVGSTARFFIFVIFEITLFLVIISHALFETLVPTDEKMRFCTILLSLLSIIAVNRATHGPGLSISQFQIAEAFSFGKKSIFRSFQEQEEKEITRPDLLLSFFMNVRKRIGPSERIMSLSQAPGSYASAPGDGILSEPSYSFPYNYLDVIFGEPELAVSNLKKTGINYFHVSLKEYLFNGLAFSRLFSKHNFKKYFRIIYSEGDNYLLTWKIKGVRSTLPTKLIKTFEAKRKSDKRPFGIFYQNPETVLAILTKGYTIRDILEQESKNDSLICRRKPRNLASMIKK